MTATQPPPHGKSRQNADRFRRGAAGGDGLPAGGAHGAAPPSRHAAAHGAAGDGGRGRGPRRAPGHGGRRGGQAPGRRSPQRPWPRHRADAEPEPAPPAPRSRGTRRGCWRTACGRWWTRWARTARHHPHPPRPRGCGACGDHLHGCAGAAPPVRELGRDGGASRVPGPRLRAAADRLASTDLPLARIACETGFADQAHLTRALRRETGLTPAALRRHAAGSIP